MAIILVFLVQGLLIRILPKRYYRIIAFATVIVLAYMSFNIVVYEASDLASHHQQIDYYRSLGWSFAVDYDRLSGNVLTAVSYWLVSFLENDNWYQTIAIFIIYSCLFSLIWKVAEDNEYDNKWLCKTTLFVTLCFSYYLAIFAVRIWIVFAVLALCFYVDCVRNKHKLLCWSIYILCVLFHYATLLLLVSRIAIFFVSNSDKTFGRYVKLFCLSAIIGLVVYFTMQTNFATYLLDKAIGYDSYEVRGTWQTLNCWVRLVMVFVMALLYRKYNPYKTFGKNYALIVIFTFIIAVVQFSNYQITLRFADAVIAFSPLLVMPRSVKTRRFVLSFTDVCMLGATTVNLVYNLIFDYRLLHFSF